jgi:hypothetical protein
MMRFMKALSSLAAVQGVLLLAGVSVVRANATCSIDCWDGEPLTCTASGTGCDCSAHEDFGCEAACANPDPDTFPDEKDCAPKP